MAKSILHTDIFDTLSWHETVLHKPKDVILGFDDFFGLKFLDYLLCYAMQEYKTTGKVPNSVTRQLSSSKQGVASLIKLGYYLAKKNHQRFASIAGNIYNLNNATSGGRSRIIKDFEALISDPKFTIWHLFQRQSLFEFIDDILLAFKHFEHEKPLSTTFEESMPILLSLLQLIQALDRIYHNPQVVTP